VDIRAAFCPACIPYRKVQRKKRIQEAAASKANVCHPWYLSLCNKNLLELLGEETRDRSLQCVDRIFVCSLCYAMSRREESQRLESNGAEPDDAWYKFPFRKLGASGPKIDLTGVANNAKPRFRDCGLVGPVVVPLDAGQGGDGAAAVSPGSGGDGAPLARRLLPEMAAVSQTETVKSVYDINGNVSMFTAGDVENLIAFVVSNGSKCTNCQALLLPKLFGQTTEQGRRSVTQRVLLVCKHCQVAFKDRYYRANYSAAGGHAAHVAAFRLALGCTSVTQQRSGASAISDVIPTREACQRVAGFVTTKIQDLEHVVSSDLCNQVKQLLEVHDLNLPWQQKTAEDIAAIAANSPFFFSFDGFYNSLAGRNAQWAGATLFITSRVSGVSVQIASIAKSTVTAWAHKLPQADVILSNARGAEFLLAVLLREKLFAAGVKSLPILVCDADASVQQAFQSFAFCISIDRNHFVKAMLRSTNALGSQLSGQALHKLEGVKRSEVLQEFREAIEAGNGRASTSSRKMHQPTVDELVAKPFPVHLKQEYEALWYAPLAEGELRGIPLVEALHFVDSAGKIVNMEQDFILQRLRLFNLEPEAAQEAELSESPPAGVAADIQESMKSSAAAQQTTQNVDSGVPSNTTSPGSKRQRSRLDTKSVQEIICGLIRRNVLQSAAVCLAKNDPSLLRQLCQIWIDHYAGKHSSCALLFPGGCTPSMAPLPVGGAALAYLTALIDSFIGEPGKTRIESIAVALALHSNACESAGASVRHYAQKNVSFRSRWKDAVYKHFLDKACGDLHWRQVLAKMHGITLTGAHIKFLQERELQRAAKAAASLSGAASRTKTSARHNSTALRAHTKKGGAMETYKCQGRPSKELFEKALTIIRAGTKMSASGRAAFPAAGSQVHDEDTQGLSGTFEDLSTREEPILLHHEGQANGWLHGQLRYVDDFDGASFVAKEFYTTLGWLQIFWTASSRSDLLEGTDATLERDPKGKLTYLVATHSGPRDGSEDDCRQPLGVLLDTEDLSDAYMKATAISGEELEMLLH